MPEILGLDGVRAVLQDARTIAVIGASATPGRPGHYVPAYLAAQGYRVVPVNPRLVGRELFGAPVIARVDQSPIPVDLVDVFRRPEALAPHVPEILAMVPRPRTVWLQLGIRHPGVVAALVDAGLDVVQDRCTLADHRALGLGPAGTT